MSRVSGNSRGNGMNRQHEQRYMASPNLDGEIHRTSTCIKLGPRSRLLNTLVSEDDILVVREGTLALEAVPLGGRRQVLDFLMPGDAFLVSIAITKGPSFLRAVTGVLLDRYAHREGDVVMECPDMFSRLEASLARRDLYQIMIGQLDAEPRAATFLLSLALRCNHALNPDQLLDLPMSRDDIADYLSMSPDTLSRIMMRFEIQALIRRVNRHSIRLLDVEGLGRRTPLRRQLLSVMCASSPEHLELAS